MSLLKVNEVTPNTRLLTGCGDGVRNEPRCEKPSKNITRTPVPSCRRFCTRPSPNLRNGQADVKLQLKKAIEELATHPNITRRRALTMAEITPTRNVKRNSNELQMSPSSASKGTRTNKLARLVLSKKDDAGRRIYQVLLLNAWRRQKLQLKTLTDSFETLKKQNENFELQVDALKRLRQSECDKRNEAVIKNHELLNRIEEVEKEKATETNEKEALERAFQTSEDKCQNLHLNLENARNDWSTARCELRNVEHQLGIERDKIRNFKAERNLLTGKLSQKEKDILALIDQIDDLQERLLHTEISLQDAVLSNNNYTHDIKELLEQIANETAKNSELKEILQNVTCKNKELKEEIEKWIKTIEENSESLKKTNEDNLALTRELTETKIALKNEKERPWWRNAGELAMVPLNALQNAAYVMLPAIPHPTSRNTSPSNIQAKPIPK